MNTFQSLLILITVFGVVTHGGAQNRIATVDLNKIVKGYYKTKQAEELLKGRGAELEKAQRALLDDYKKASEDYKKLLDGSNDQAVSFPERERCKSAAEAKLRGLKEL